MTSTPIINTGDTEQPTQMIGLNGYQVEGGQLAFLTTETFL